MQLSRVLLRNAALSLLASAVATVAQADCPTVSSVERYAESSRDALIALSGALPPDQYLDLENRYAATIVMEWNLIGVDAILDDETALAKIYTCFRDELCGADGNDGIDQQLTDLIRSYDLDAPAMGKTLGDAPSASMLEWAEIELGCRAAPQPEPELEAELDVELIAETETQQESEDEPQQSDITVESVPEEAPTDLVLVDEGDTSVEETTFVAQVTPLPTINGDPRDLVQTAAAFIASGEVERAIPPLQDACFYEAGKTQNSIACETLLDVYEARTLYGDEEVATSIYLSFSEEICAGGYINGCENMAHYLRAANTNGAYERGVQFTARSCNLGDADACAMLAQDHIEGRTEHQDLAFARTTLERSCELGRLDSCREVADLYIRGVGGESDNIAALQAVALACPEVEARSPDLCVSAADFVLINMRDNEDRAALVRDFTKRACDIGHSVGCAWYAEDLELGIGGSVDTDAAREARLTACEYGDTESCRPRS